MKHRGSFLHRMDALDRYNVQRDERTDGRKDSLSVRPSLRCSLTLSTRVIRVAVWRSHHGWKRQIGITLNLNLETMKTTRDFSDFTLHRRSLCCVFVGTKTEMIRCRHWVSAPCTIELCVGIRLHVHTRLCAPTLWLSERRNVDSTKLTVN